MARTVDLGVTKYVWIPGADGIADETAPTVTEATATGAVDISSMTLTTTTLDVEASDTVSEKAVTDVSNTVTPTVGNYSGSLVMFRDLTAGVPSADDALTTIGDAVGVVGWVLKRVGPASTQALAADDLVDVYLVMIDNPMTTGGADDGYLKVTFTLLQQGSFQKNVALVAGS